jgi:hypothetical protein
MREVPISRYLNMNLVDLLRKLDAVGETSTYATRVYLSHEDAAVLRRNNRRKIRSQMKYASKKAVDHAIGMDWLNHGPNTSLGKSIRPGWALVDDDGIRTDKFVERVRKAIEEKLEEPQPPTLKERLLAFFEKHFIFRGPHETAGEG